MKGIILAAGRGKRMGEKTKDLPKCLLEIQGRPLLQIQLEAFIQNHITEIGIVTGWQKEKVVDSRISKYFINEKWAETNSCYSLYQAREWLKKESCIISYSDLFYSPKCLENLVNSDDSLAITYDPNYLQLWKNRFINPIEDLESFRLNSKSEVLEIGNKISSFDQAEGQYMGLIKITPEIWCEIEAVLSNLSNEIFYTLDMTSLFKILLEKKIKIKAISIENEKWGEVDQLSDLNLYNFKSS
jgi:choline kinase